MQTKFGWENKNILLARKSPNVLLSQLNFGSDNKSFFKTTKLVLLIRKTTFIDTNKLWLENNKFFLTGKQPNVILSQINFGSDNKSFVERNKLVSLIQQNFYWYNQGKQKNFVGGGGE